ncbi:MAG: DesA family fatty acid desaturase [Immundisolibacter sp.]|uniref:DesA family fatty acid desaturase n=1 Tax=Immundisolibacter sp. TaxID=1934948 RepID=UPI003EE07C07
MQFPEFWSAFADANAQWLGYGFSGFSGWEIVAYTLLTTHVTIVSVTVFLHRSQAHRALDLHPVVSHFFRLWLWLTTGIKTRQWVAVHRKHHARCETDEDPHSPQTRGIGAVLLTGSELYRAEAQRPATLERFGRGTPDDWLEQNLYARYSWQGVGLTLILNLFLFGAIGAVVWAVQMLWIPIMAAGIVNGIGHWWGYRNFEAPDASRNFSPWGILIGGEELHNNHHTYPTSAKLSVKTYEFDIGWAYIRLLEMLHLASVNRTVPRLRFGPLRTSVDASTLTAVVNHRFELMATYARRVRAATVVEMRNPAVVNGGDADRLSIMRLAKPWLHRDADKIPPHAKAHIARALSVSSRLTVLIEMREKLQRLWTSKNVSKGQLLADFQSWLHEAEQSGIASLQDFASRLRSVKT